MTASVPIDSVAAELSQINQTHEEGMNTPLNLPINEDKDINLQTT